MKPYYKIAAVDNTVTHAGNFDTLKQAEKQALIEAFNQPGKNIEILKCIGIASCSKPCTFWMDEEEAPAVDSREFIFFKNHAGTVFWRVGMGSIQIGTDYSRRWESSTMTLPELINAFVQISADELPEELA